ncbi:uncharacterized protein LOC132799683 [Ziziphus jujuba]|uniref:Uncharacterized protein LOC132799683 n=1 Tax=Ziziphus jujuba TaxID=326968 RepID=A0ABM3ZUF5_ZIZJJ|nr:uncharacterized protein LOC132799683 [Ziziphus jujuba]
MEGIVDLLRQQLQVIQALSSGTKPFAGQEEQVQAFSTVPEGNMTRTDAPTVPTRTNGNEGRIVVPERQLYIPPPIWNPIHGGGVTENQGQNVRNGREEQIVLAPQAVPHGGHRDHNLGDDRPRIQKSCRSFYRRPYLEAIDRIEFPRGFRFSEFILFSGEENQSIVEHIDRFTIQCEEAAANEFLKLCLFANSLTGSAFSWYINLQLNSNHTWQELERKFHEQFYRIEPEISMADLSCLRQMEGESVENFIARFKRTRIRCRLDIPEREFVKLA